MYLLWIVEGLPGIVFRHCSDEMYGDDPVIVKEDCMEKVFNRLLGEKKLIGHVEGGYYKKILIKECSFGPVPTVYFEKGDEVFVATFRQLSPDEKIRFLNFCNT